MSSPSFSILAFGPGVWPRGWVAGSPRYHLHGLAGRGAKVVYVEPPQGRLRAREAVPSDQLGTPGTLEAWPDRPLRVYHPRSRLFFHPRLPLPAWMLRYWNRRVLRRLSAEAAEALAREGIREFDCPDILWLGGYSHAPLLSLLPHRRSVAFIYDDLPASPAFRGRAQRIVSRLETELLDGVDLAIFTSRPLYESRKDRCRRALLLENAVCDSFFQDSLPPPPPEGFSRVLREVEALPKPRVGYVGALNVRLDLEICHALGRAAAARKFHLVFAGPIDRYYAKGVETLRGTANVHFPGSVPPWEVPHLLRHLDVLILPHVLTPFTRGMFPEKLPEYLTTGLPIISTRLPEVVRVASCPEGAVEFADTPAEFVAACERAATLAIAPGLLKMPEGIGDTSLDIVHGARTRGIHLAAANLAGARIALARRHTRATRLPLLIQALDEILSLADGKE